MAIGFGDGELCKRLTFGETVENGLGALFGCLNGFGTGTFGDADQDMVKLILVFIAATLLLLFEKEFNLGAGDVDAVVDITLAKPGMENLVACCSMPPTRRENPA